MSDQRQELLRLLQRAYALAQNVEPLLRRFSDRHATHVGLAAAMDAFLTQTLDQQRVLRECLQRIEDGEHTPRLLANGGLAANLRPAGQSGDDALRDLAHVRALILEEIDLYHSGILIAESSGFFETRFVCEGILTQKSLMSEWLSLHTPAIAGASGQRVPCISK
jgi:ferritin-like metal-binding protein YciE